MKQFYAMIEEDRHTDVLVVVFDDPERAIADARERAASKDVTEEPVEGWLFNAGNESADYNISVRAIESHLSKDLS